MPQRTHVAPGMTPEKKAQPRVGVGLFLTGVTLAVAAVTGKLELSKNTPEGPNKDEVAQVHALVGSAAIRAQNIEAGTVIPLEDGLLQVTIHEPAKDTSVSKSVDETRYVHITQLNETATDIAREYDEEGVAHEGDINYIQTQGSGQAHMLMAGDPVLMPRDTQPPANN